MNTGIEEMRGPEKELKKLMKATCRRAVCGCKTADQQQSKVACVLPDLITEGYPMGAKQDEIVDGRSKPLSTGLYVVS